MWKGLNALKDKYPIIKEIRGKGLMIGIELTDEGKPVVDKCMEAGLLINCTQGKVLRMMPPLGIKKAHAKRALGILERALK